MIRRQFLSAVSMFGLSAFVVPQVAWARQSADFQWFERARPLMGTIVSIGVYDSSEARAQALISDCFNYMQLVISRISDWDAHSFSSRLRQQRKMSIKQCASELLALISVAEQARTQSKGQFNPLCLNSSILWRDARNSSSIPEKSQIKFAQKQAADTHCLIRAGEISLSGTDSFDFGGIGKGFLADKAGEYLRARGAEFARVACSGDIKFIGDTLWTVELEDPRSESILGEVQQYGSFGIATSGDYRSCWEINGQRYHHLIDPNTGLPGQYCQQTTVIHSSATVADALASAAFFAPASNSISKLLPVFGARGVIVDQAHKVSVSRGLNFRVRS